MSAVGQKQPLRHHANIAVLTSHGMISSTHMPSLVDAPFDEINGPVIDSAE
jgi:hypothetical protein